MSTSLRYFDHRGIDIEEAEDAALSLQNLDKQVGLTVGRSNVGYRDGAYRRFWHRHLSMLTPVKCTN